MHARHDIVVVGASAGGVDALTTLCASLPPDLPAAMFIVLHVTPTARSMLGELLGRAGRLPVRVPVDGETVRQGHIYVAAPDRHMLLRPGRILMRRGPHENRTRPAIDALFRSAAIAYGPRVIGVVLTGLLDDGTEGLTLIKRAGGLTMVQDPLEAAWPSMPLHALARDHVDHALPVGEMGGVLARLTRQPAGPAGRLPEPVLGEDRIAEQEFVAMDPKLSTPGLPSRLSCPQCGGVLNEIKGIDPVPRFRCQVGHAFTASGLAVAQEEKLEEAIVVASRTHRERMKLFRSMETNANAQHLPHAAARWRKAADEAERYARVLETALSTLGQAAVQAVEEPLAVPAAQPAPSPQGSAA